MGPNITPGGALAGWTHEDFVTAMRTGVTPDGSQLDGEMPWAAYATMSDTELDALWSYIQSVPALPDN